MRTVSDAVSVRLYHLAEAQGGGATTLMYGTMAEALAMAARQDEDTQAALFLQTSDDVVPYLDFID
ncbi:hypothetical protein ACT009_16530 [Sphingomonas sp. Tas61C01]|uniref:hypothetical protein n=1 Tax=Sphingomonas sp. Tas61C01 TaxID=3458297 RepID=UPI00403EB8E0